MAYVKDVTMSGTIMIFTFSDCTTKEFDLCIECPEVPIDENPGNWPEPVEGELTRCRVAVHVGEFVAERLANYLDGLNLSTYVPFNTEAYVASKIAEYGWPIGVYGDMLGFTQALYIDNAAGTGLDAETDWLAGSTEDIANAQEMLYCAIDATGKIDEGNRSQWSANLAPMGQFEVVLSEFVKVYPLFQLRELAFDASTNTAAVDCDDFDCVSPSECEIVTPMDTLYGAAQSVWSTQLLSYGAPPRDARSFHVGVIDLELPSTLCVTHVRVSHAGQFGSAWQKVQLQIDGNNYPVQSSKMHTSCNSSDATSNLWTLPAPIKANTIRIVGSDQNPSATGNANSPHVIFCIRVYHG